MKILYIDAAAGASGDMLAGAMLDLGWPLKQLEDLLLQMGLEAEAGVGIDYPVHQGIRSSRLRVELLTDVKHEAHHHDHHHHAPHHHEHPHLHSHGSKRGLSQIKEILSRLAHKEIAGQAERVFSALAAAEAKAHGISAEEVHFHEVGAVDAIVDIVAFCAAIAWLKPERILCSPLPLGRGFVNCAHGRLPLPAPAVLNLLQGIPVTTWPEEVETVTPTGAAILSVLVDEFTTLPSFTLFKSGVGGGSRLSAGQANLLRVLWGEKAELTLGHNEDEIVEISCNLDDQLGEDFPFISETLMAAGALDVTACPLLMKKGRPALQINVLCRPDKTEDMAALLLKQSTSLGVRVSVKKRYLLPRQISAISTPWGEVRIKSAVLANGELRHHPEAEDVLAICRRTGLSPALLRQKIYALLAAK